MFQLSASTVFSKLFVEENKVRGNKNSFERIDVRIIGIPVSRFQLVNLSTKCLSVVMNASESSEHEQGLRFFSNI